MSNRQIMLVVLSLGFTVCLPAAATAQVGRVQIAPPGTPVRDQPQRFGTAALKGRVVDGATGAAIARARVRIMGPAGQRPPVMTDASGGFAFTGLPAGGYSLMVEKATYLMARHPAGGRTVRSSMRPMLVRDGETLDNVTVPMFRGGAISGRVLDAHGDPVEYADVRVMRLAPGGGRPSMVGGNSTNDLGEFRVSRLQPGRYLMMIVPRRTGPDDASLEAEPPPQPLPTYFPGTPSLDQAQPIAIERGQTLSGLEIMLGEGTPSVVSGTVVNTQGDPVTTGAYLNARAIVKDLPGFFDGGGGASVRPDGTFRMTLAPGEYRIEARVNSPMMSSAPARPDGEQFGTARVSLTPGGHESLTIVVGPGAIVSGRVVFEGTSQIPTVPSNYGPPFFTSEAGECRTGRTQFGTDWTFRIEGLGGTCSASPPFGLGAWTLKAILRDGENLLDEAVTFETGQEVRNLQVVLTDKRTDINLRVSDEQGQQTREYVAFVFPVNKERRAQSRFIRTYMPPSPEVLMMQAMGRGGSTGSAPGMPGVPPPPPEAVRGLPPGDYYAVAVDDIEVDSVRDPVLMERLIPSATRVSLGDGGSADVTLRRIQVLGAER